MAERKPNFFIVGAPKCGTTSLYHWLDTHPEICMSKPKEPHFFHPTIESSCRSLAEYEQCYAHALPRHAALGEASTHTVYSGEAIDEILEYQPEARFVVCLRNPVDMAVSLHNMLVHQGAQPRRDFLEAWNSDKEIWVWFVQRSYRSGEVYRDWCALGTHFENLARHVPEGRLMSIVLDDFVLSPQAELNRLARFLDVSAHEAPFPRRNTARQPRSILLNRVAHGLGLWKRRLGFRRSLGLGRRILRANVTSEARVARVTPETRAILLDHFGREISRLAELLDRDLSHWLEPEKEPSRHS